MNLQTTLELIQTTAVSAAAATLVDIPGDGRTAWVQQDGELLDIPVPPPTRRHIVYELDDLARYARRVVEEVTKPAPAVVWIGTSSVVLVIDDLDRRDTVRIDLEIDPRFALLKSLSFDRPFSQGDFIRLLRLGLEVDESFIAQWRHLRWRKSANEDARMEAGNESVSRELLAQLEGYANMPTELDYRTCVYAHPDLDTEYTITLGIEIDPDRKRIHIVPMPGQIIEAQQQATDAVHGRLSEALYAIADPYAIGSTDPKTNELTPVERYHRGIKLYTGQPE